MKIAFITNMCTHYSVRLFELLAEKLNIEYYFTGGHESYWEQKNRPRKGNFKYQYLGGFFLLPRFKITPALFSLFFKKCGVIIKTIDGRFALPLVFLIAKIRR